MAGICDVPIISNVCTTVGQGAATLIAAPFDWLAQSVGAAASWMFQGVWALFDTTTLVDLTKPGYTGVYNVIFGIGIFLMLIFFCLQLITGLIRRDPSALTRAATGLARSVLGSFLVITLTTTLLQIVDQLTIGVIQATGTTLQEMGGKIGALVAGLTAINLTAPGAGAIVTIFLSFLALTGAAIVWFSLLIRKALILVAVVMAPIALSGGSWDATRGWFGKWASFVLALIFSKLVIVVVFLVAINQTGAPIDLDLASIADPVAGIVLMFVAAFAPYMVYRFIAFVGFDMYHAIATEQDAKQSLNRPLPLPGKPSGPAPKQVLDGGGSSPTGSGAAPAPAGAPVPGGDAGAGGSAGAAGPSAGGGAAASGGGGATATGGGAAGGGAGAAAGASAAAGPIGLGVAAAATVVKGAAEAGPKAGAAVSRAAEGHASLAQDNQTPPGAHPPQPSPPVPSALSGTGSSGPTATPPAEQAPMRSSAPVAAPGGTSPGPSIAPAPRGTAPPVASATASRQPPVDAAPPVHQQPPPPRTTPPPAKGAG